MDTTPKISAKLHTAINLKPERSQVVLVAFIILSTICFIAGFIFLWYKHPYFFVPIVLGLLFAFVSKEAWNISRHDVDMANATPTTIKDGKSGAEVTTDTRVLSSVEMVQELGNLLTSLCNRTPLPEPSGLVNDDGSPNPDKKAEAQEHVRKVNETTAELTKQAVSFIAGGRHDEVIEQPLIEMLGDEILSKTNVEMRND